MKGAKERFEEQFSESAAALERIKDLLVSAIKKRNSLDLDDEAKAFSMVCLVKELKCLGIDLSKEWDNLEEGDWSDLNRRLAEWGLARVNWWAYWSAKIAPRSPSLSKDRRSAYETAIRVRRRHTDHPKVGSFISTATPDLYAFFLSCVAGSTPAQWKRPKVDMWLFSIWPLVERYKWTPRETWMVLGEKFSSNEDDDSFFDTSHRLAKHCRTELGLAFQNSKSGRVTLDNESSLPEMAELALTIDHLWTFNDLGK